MTRRLTNSRDGPSRDLVWALQQLEATCGRIGVNALAQELGCSRKHLTVRFRREFGLPPKLFARVARFDRAIELMRRDRVASLAELASDCGYADQAYLTRDFASLPAARPRRFCAANCPTKADLSTDARDQGAR